MIRVIFSAFLLLLFSSFAFAQEVYQFKPSRHEFLYIGSVKETAQKYLDLDSNEIVWREATEKIQVDQLSPGDFFKTVMSHDLVFHVDGAKPYWSAVLSQNKLDLQNYDGEHLIQPIEINLKENPIDGVFLLAFHTPDKNIYGFIRKLYADIYCDFTLNDENSNFEIYINFNDNVMKGCVTLDRIKPMKEIL